MSVAQPDVTELRAWWSPFHLWRQFIISVALSASCFLLGWYLIKLGFPLQSFQAAFSHKDAALLMAFAGTAIASFLMFDACWLAALFGATWKGVLFFPLRPRFWQFAFAWVIIDLLFISSYLRLADTLDLIEVDKDAALNLAKTVLSLGIGVSALALFWIRCRLFLWPTHVLATGRIGDLQTPWQMTGGKRGSLFDLSIGIIFLAAVFLAIAVAIALVLMPTYFGDSAYVVIPLMVLAIPLVFRSLQLSAFAERYRSISENSPEA
jgi:hypothetical protein